MDKSKFINLMKGIKSAYPQFKAVDTSQGLSMWYQMLKDISYEDLSKAIYKHIATNKYPPSIAEIRALANGQSIGLEKSDDPVSPENIEKAMQNRLYEEFEEWSKDRLKEKNK